jgi:uncharacterized membrane protein
LWIGGLLVLPIMLSRHDPAVTQDDYRRVRAATHMTYAYMVTPAAVVAGVAGTWLIFFREVFVPWLYAKLVVVALLAAAHVWVGQIVVDVAEKPGKQKPPRSYLPVTAVMAPVLIILVLVLGKPELEEISLPSWLEQPRGGQLPFEVPRR